MYGLALASASRKHVLFFMDYGITSPRDDAPELEALDEPDRLLIQFYHRVVAGIDRRGRVRKPRG